MKRLSKTIFAAALAFSSAPQASTWKSGELNCLVKSVFYESRGESLSGQRAVVDVIMNRVDSNKWPNTICGVVFQQYQFSWTAEDPEIHLGHPQFQTIKHDVLQWIDMPRSTTADHYHATSVDPDWNTSMQKISQIGNHIFYKS